MPAVQAGIVRNCALGRLSGVWAGARVPSWAPRQRAAGRAPYQARGGLMVLQGCIRIQHMA